MRHRDRGQGHRKSVIDGQPWVSFSNMGATRALLPGPMQTLRRYPEAPIGDRIFRTANLESYHTLAFAGLPQIGADLALLYDEALSSQSLSLSRLRHS